jgi:hypothetical protein
MAKLNFKMGQFANLANTNMVAGTVYVTTDEGGMYVDISNDKRIRLNQIISYDTFEAFVSAIAKTEPPYSTEAFYYIVKDNALLKYVTSGGEWDPNGDPNKPTKGNWVQINSTADVENALGLLENRVEALENWKKDTNDRLTGIDGDIADLKEADVNFAKEDAALNKKIDDEIKRAIAAEKKIAEFNAEGAVTGGALFVETERAKSAESTLTTNLNAEINRAKGVEESLKGDINDEIATRIDEISRVEGLIAAEAEARAEADETLQGNIDNANKALNDYKIIVNNKLDNHESRLDTIGGDDGSGGLIGQLTGDIAELEKADGTINGRIDSVVEDLSKEVERAKGAEQTLTTNLNAEINRAKGAEQTLTTNLNAEINRAKGAEEALRGDLGEEINRAKSAEEKIAKFDSNDKLVDGALLDVKNELISTLNIADAMKYMGVVAAESELPTTSTTNEKRPQKGHTYKVTAEITPASGSNIQLTSQKDKKVRIGDLLVANGTEDNDGYITSGTLIWEHIPSGYVADYNPKLSVNDVATGGAAITLTKGDATSETVAFNTVTGNTSLKVSGDQDGVYFSLEWGTF